MNISHLYHTLIALSALGLIGYATGNWWAGACFGSAFYIGREHAQHEAKLGKGAKPWSGFFGQSLDSLLDWLVPTCIVFGTAYVLSNVT